VSRLRVGIAGYGVVGRRRRQFIDQHPELECVAVCDRKLDGARTADGVRAHADYRGLLAEPLDVLFVSLPNDLAPNVTIAGLDKGLHVFCEKPPGRTIADIERVIAAERAKPRLKLKYGFNHRYHEAVREALNLSRGGELGPLINLRGVYGKSAIVSFESDWRTQRAVAGGGILLDQGIHMVDLMRLFAGDFVEVKSFVSNAFWNHDVEDNAYALMRSEGGAIAMLHSTATQWRHRFQLEMSFARGALVLTGILSGSKSYGEERLTIVRRGADDRGVPPEQTMSYIDDNSWRDEIAEFAAAIRADAPIVNGSSGDALKTMALVYRIYCADPAWRERWNLSDRVTLNA
jgi:predicted dehydrogenase